MSLLFWLELALKMALTATVVVVTSLVVERSGAFIGAMIAALPTAAGAAYVILAIEHPPAFIAASAVGSMTIGAAVAASNPGDTIHVCPGLYAEQVQIKTNNLTLLGANAGIDFGRRLAMFGEQQADVRGVLEFRESGDQPARVAANPPDCRATLQRTAVHEHPHDGGLGGQGTATESVG